MEEQIKTKLFYGIILLIHVSYVLLFFGVFYINKSYIATLSSCVQIFVSIFLIWRFNPFREWLELKEHKMTNFDKIIIYSSATFLLVNVGLTAAFTRYFINNVEIRLPSALRVRFANGS